MVPVQVLLRLMLMEVQVLLVLELGKVMVLQVVEMPMQQGLARVLDKVALRVVDLEDQELLLSNLLAILMLI
jgi:hypothetical protein